MQGKSILPLTKGETEEWQEDVFIQISESQVARAIRTKRWKYGVNAADKHPWNDSYSDKYTEEFLYDLDADPYELTNIIHLDGFQEIALDMKERLLRRIYEVEGKRPEIVEVEKVPSGQRTDRIR